MNINTGVGSSHGASRGVWDSFLLTLTPALSEKEARREWEIVEVDNQIHIFPTAGWINPSRIFDTREKVARLWCFLDAMKNIMKSEVFFHGVVDPLGHPPLLVPVFVEKMDVFVSGGEDKSLYPISDYLIPIFTGLGPNYST